MCQWHMFSTDRSRAEMWEHVVQNNPVSEDMTVYRQLGIEKGGRLWQKERKDFLEDW